MRDRKIIPFDPGEPNKAFSRCRDVLRGGGVIAFPTETFYGLGADPRDRGAVQRLFSIKGRTADQPILLLIASVDDVAAWAARVPDAARVLMDRFWPGALTLVLPARTDVPADLTAGSGTIGLRVPGSGTARALIAFCGHALTGTSANRAGGEPPRTAQEVEAGIGADIDLILDAGPTPGGRPSTVVNVSSGVPRTVREGAVRIG